MLPRPLDDYRIFVLLATLALLPAALLFPGALHVRLAAGAALAANPILVNGAWFGTADAPALLALVLAFALLARGRLVWAAASLGAALALKQFALVAVPFFAVMLLTKGVPRRAFYRAGAAFGGVFLASVMPFLVADPGALWHDTVSYGAGTYRIVGYGLAALLLNLGVDRRPLRLLPVLAARARALAAGHGLVALEPEAGRDAVVWRGWVFDFDVRVAFPEPGFPELVPRLAFDRHRAFFFARRIFSQRARACQRRSCRKRGCGMSA